MKKYACDVCLINCVRIHGDEDYDQVDQDQEEITPAGSSGPGAKEDMEFEPTGPKEDGPAEPATPSSFLKTVTDLSITSALELPAAFEKDFATRIGAKVTLEGPGIEKWEVEIGCGKEENCLEFQKGWHEFVVHHALLVGDQLTFTHSTDSSFHVVVYDESGSQKICATSATGAMNSTLRRLLEAKTLIVNQGEPSVGFRIKPSARPKQKVRRRIRTDHGAVTPVTPVISPPIALSSESELEKSDAPEKETESNAKSPNGEELFPGDDSNLSLLPPHVLVDGHVVSNRRPVTEDQKDRTLEAAHALPVTNTKHVVVMTKGYVYRGFWMALARSFAKAHMPKESREITLRNVAGHSWTVKWLYKEDGSSGFSGGWRGFALDHRLEVDDVCVFEILDQKNYILLVHIFRALEAKKGVPKEDTKEYSCTPRRSRNADREKTPTGYKRKLEVISPGPSSPKKSCSGTPGKYMAPVRCSKNQDPDYHKRDMQQMAQGICTSKSEPKPATHGGGEEHSPDIEPGETLQSYQQTKTTMPSSSAPHGGEKVKIVPPITSDENKDLNSDEICKCL